MQPPIETSSVSATASAPPSPRPLSVSRTRVRNQRRTTSAVTGSCDRRARGTAARRCPPLHHRPATAPAGSTTSSEPAGPGSSPRPPAAPVPTVRCTARALGWQPAPPAWPAAHQLLDLAARQALQRTCPMMGCLGRCRRPGSLLEARWSVATVCDATFEPLAFGALQQAGR